MVTFIIVLIIVGLIAGLIARLLIPGPDPNANLATIIHGIDASYLAEYHTGSVHSFHTTGIIGSIIGAIIVLLILRLTGAERGRGRTRRRR